MMNDLNYLSNGLTQYAEGSITYGVPVGADYADGTITYGAPVGSANAGLYIDVVDYTQLVGKTVTIDGTALVEGVDWTAATDNNTTGTSLAAAIDALGNWIASGPGHVVISYATKGTVGNGKSVTTDAVGGIDINGAGVAGSTSSGGVDGDTIAVDGNTFTCVASAPGANEFQNIAGLKNLIDALGSVNATNDATTITVTAAARGAAGNAITMTLGGANAGTMAVSAATLAGGLDGDTVIVNGSTFTCVASAPGASQFSSISELEALIEALASINSSQDGTTITINADTPGAAGNAITLALGGSNAGTMAISGATLTGGVDATYTDTLQLHPNAEVVKLFVEIANIAGSGATVTITPQTSPDASDWQDLPTIVLTANGDTIEEITGLLTYFRLKIVMTGTSPSADITIQAQPSEADTEREHDFYISSALEASAVVKSSRARFYGIAGRVDETAPTDDYFVFVYDAAAVPADGALTAGNLLMVPRKINHVSGTDTEFSFSYDGSFKKATNGIVVFLSTTDDLTKTLAGAYMKVNVEHE